MTRAVTENSVALHFLNGHTLSGNGQPPASATSGSDATEADPTSLQWASIAWEESAPKRLIKNATKGNIIKLANEIARSLRPQDRRLLKAIERGAMPHPRSLIPSTNLGSDAQRGQQVSLTSLPGWKRHPSPKLSQLVDDLVSRDIETGDAAARCADLWILIGVASRLSDETLTALWLKLLQDSRRCLAERSAELEDTTAAANCSQALQAAELSVVSGLIFRHIVGAMQVVHSGLARAEQALDAATDTDGTPHADWWPTLDQGLLSAIRLLWINEWFGTGRLLRKRFRERLRRLLKRVVALGTLPVPREAIAWGLSVLGTKPTSPVLRTLEGAVTDAAPPSGRAASHSGWASLAILRSRWGMHSDVCGVGYAGHRCRVEFQPAGIPMLSGPWTFDIKVGDESADFTEDWKLMCWNSDKDGDYLELGRTAPGQASMIRQFYLSRTDSFLYLADSVRAEHAPVVYRSQLPLLPEWVSESDSLTREAALRNRRHRVRVLPVSLPQYVANASAGCIDSSAGSFCLSAAAQDTGLCSAVLLDWSPERRKQPVDWSLLSIAENGKKVGSAEAFGARVRMGDAQYMFFRSLAPPRVPRTVMGHHTPYESVIAKFEDGNFVPLLNVEAEQGENK